MMKVVEMASTTKEGVQQQVEILVPAVCPQVQHVERCKKKLPGFWMKLAPVMWSYAYDPTTWCQDVCNHQVRNSDKILNSREGL